MRTRKVGDSSFLAQGTIWVTKISGAYTWWYQWTSAHPPSGSFYYFMGVKDASSSFSHVTLLSTRNMALPRLLILIIKLRTQFPDCYQITHACCYLCVMLWRVMLYLFWCSCQKLFPTQIFYLSYLKVCIQGHTTIYLFYGWDELELVLITLKLL